MAEDEDDGTWVLDLESALSEEMTTCDSFSMYQGKEFPDSLRAECWQTCLDVLDSPSKIENFPEIYDLPEQQQLRNDCLAAFERLGNDDADKAPVLSDMESVITCYCKTHNAAYTPSWVDLLLPILALKRPRADTYAIFEALLERLVPQHGDDIYHVLRLLILYHDPELCSFLDTKRITPDMFARNWFTTLFAGITNLHAVHAIWDRYLQRSDPFFIFFLSLVILINDRANLLRMKNESKEHIIETIASMPAALEHDDVQDFCSLAMYYVLKTPKSFKTGLDDSLFGRGSPHAMLSQALCLPVSAHELVESAAEVELEDDVDRVRFFLVDCRPAEQYNAGHLSTAFHLDSNLMLQGKAAFEMAVKGLLSAQRQALAANSNAGGNHLCFLGSGRVEEDQCTYMVVAQFLQKNITYVSMLSGGYEAIHDYFGNDMSDCLEDHDDKQCLVCKEIKGPEETPPSTATNQLLSKFSTALKTKSADIKEKLIEYIVNPIGNEGPKTKNKLYRGMQPVFSIDDDENDAEQVYQEEQEEEEFGKLVSLSQYLTEPNVVEYWRCQQVTESGYTYASHLVLTTMHLIVLRDRPASKAKDGKATLVVKRALTSIIKITAKKRHPNVITFKYGGPDGDVNTICDMDRFIIPNASDATAAISKQVLNCPFLEQLSKNS